MLVSNTILYGQNYNFYPCLAAVLCVSAKVIRSIIATNICIKIYVFFFLSLQNVNSSCHLKYCRLSNSCNGSKCESHTCCAIDFYYNNSNEVYSIKEIRKKATHNAKPTLGIVSSLVVVFFRVLILFLIAYDFIRCLIPRVGCVYRYIPFSCDSTSIFSARIQ